MSNKFKEARKLMNEILTKDEGLYYAYQSNIAMLLHDEQAKIGKPINYRDHENRNKMAKSIISLVFS